MTDRSNADEPESKPSEGYEDPPMTIWEHLAELRKRLFYSVLAVIVCATIGWIYRKKLVGFLAKPFCDSWRSSSLPGPCALNFSSPAGAFTSYFHVSIHAGLLIAAPFVFFQLWAFVAPGLYAREKKFVIPFVLSSTLLFVGGSYFCWRAAFPLTFEYLLGLSGPIQEIELAVVPTIMMDNYVSFVSQMLLAFGLVFELPLLIFFLSLAGIINYLHLIQFGRYFIVGAFFLAAVLTPPDITSQLVLGIPLVLLYGISIGLAFLFGKPPSKEQRERFSARRRKEAA